MDRRDGQVSYRVVPPKGNTPFSASDLVAYSDEQLQR